MNSRTRILFLDDDPVMRVLRLVLCNAENDPWIRDFFAPEDVDLSRLVNAAPGLRRSDGVDVLLAGDPASGAVDDATIIIFRRGAVTRELLDRHPRLRLVQRLGERADEIDLAGAAARGVRVSCLPRRTLHFTAEHTLLLMLSLAKRLPSADRAVREGAYDAARIRPIDDVAYNWAALQGATGLHGKTLGIIGLGEVGTLVGGLARAFGMSVLYHKRRRATSEQEATIGAQYAELADLLAGSDFVSLHAANLAENDRFADRAFFAGMRKSAFFVNTSRGRLVDEDALYQALAGGGIAGAGLDVHRVEPRAAHDRFASLSNVVLTPHIAGGARGGLLDELEAILRNCSAAQRIKPLEHEVRTA